MKIFQAGVLLLLAAGTQAATAAAFTYTYTGNDFNSVNEPSLSTSDFIRASFTIAAPLGDNLSNADESGAALSWSITDQVTTITPASADAAGNLVISVTTNAAGEITEWDFQDRVGDCTVDCTIINTLNLGPTDFFDQSMLCIDNTCGSSSAGNYVQPGVWTSAAVSAPEPSTTILAPLGGIILLLAMVVGQPPRSARVPPDPLFAPRKADEGVGCGPGGRPTLTTAD